MKVRITNPGPLPVTRRLGGRPAPVSGPLGIRRGAADKPDENPCQTCGVGVPPNPPGNATSRQRHAWAASQIRHPNPGPEMVHGPQSAAQMLAGRRQRRMHKMALGLRGELATPERVGNPGDVGPTLLALRATTTPASYPNLFAATVPMLPNVAPTRQGNPGRPVMGSMSVGNPWVTYWGTPTYGVRGLGPVLSPGPGYGWGYWGWRPRSAPAVPFGSFATGSNWPWNGTAPYPRGQRWYYNPPVPQLPAPNPGWFAVAGAGLLGAAAGAFANCYPRKILEWETTDPNGAVTRLAMQFGPCLTKERFEARVSRDFKDGTAPQQFGPAYFDDYEQALAWADEQAGFSWRERMTAATATATATTTPQIVQAHLAGMNPYTQGVNQWVGNIGNQPPGVWWRSPARALAQANMRRAMFTSGAQPTAPSTFPPGSPQAKCYSKCLDDGGDSTKCKEFCTTVTGPGQPVPGTGGIGFAQRLGAPKMMTPAGALARANIRAAMNPAVWPPASAHSQFAPLPPQWFYYQAPTTAGAPMAPGVPVAAPGPPPGVWGRGNICYADRDCRKNEYCHGGVCVPAPWGGAQSNPGARMESMTVPLVPGYAAAA